jgi:hypothetical protein
MDHSAQHPRDDVRRRIDHRTARRRRRRGAVQALLAALSLLAGTAARADWLAPLTIETATTIPSGQINVLLGASYARDARFPPFTPDGYIRSQNLVAAPEIGFRAGIGSMVEVQASYEFLYNDEENVDGSFSNYGGGDARLFTKIYAVRERTWIPAMGFRFGTKLPNASSSDRLGTDELDFFLQWLASKQIGPITALVNLGISLLDNPGFQGSNAGGQDDLFTYALGVVTPRLSIDSAGDWQIRLLGEFNGQTGSRFDNDANTLRAGAQVTSGGLTLYAGPSAGLSGAAADYGVMGGAIYAFDVERLAALLD